MKIWLLKTSEKLPVSNKNIRLMKMGMLAEKLSEQGHEISWFSSSFDHFEKKQLFPKDIIIEKKDNYKIYLAHAPGYKKNISIMRILNHKITAIKFRKISNTIEKPDLIYVSFPTIDYAKEAIRYGKKNKIPVIIDIRDLWPDIFNHNLKGIVKIFAQPYIKILNAKTKKIMKSAFALNSNSEGMLRWGLNKAAREKSIYDRVFYIGYQKENFDINSDVKKLINENKFNISFFASINNQFNYDIIINLAKKIQEIDKDIIFNIGGDGPKFQELQEKSQNLNNINLFGWVDKSTIDYVLKNSKLGLAPYNNTFDFQMNVPNKFAEYLAYGLPVVLTVDGYMKKIVDENNCGISSQNVNELCNFILELKNNPEKQKNMSGNAIKLYDENFVADNIYSDLINYLEDIVKKN